MTGGRANPLARYGLGALGFVVVVVLFCMMLLTFADVGGRYLLRRPVFGGYEVTEFMMGILIFAALPILCWREGHVAIDVFDNVLPRRLIRPHRFAINLISAAVLGALAWRLFVHAGDLVRTNEVTMTLKVPHGPFAYAFASLSALACCASLAVCAGYVTGRRQPADMPLS